ncbi:MAG: O-antigen ligase family protein [Lachnospiraceae bacterium]|nr:O-antigen ligase family protein [Lachnospiraceae bacterium]
MKKRISFGLVPALVLCGILPFIVRLNILKIDLWQYPWFPNQKEWGDFFLYGKMQLFLVIAVVALLVLIDAWLIKGEKLKFTKEWFWLLAYEAFCVLSAVFSANKEISFQGSIEQFEGLWVLLGYGFICVYGFYLAKNKNNIRALFGVVVIAGVFFGILGLSQLMQKDLLNSQWILSLIIPEKLAEYREHVLFNFSNEEVNRVYLTLYNPNYVGVYMALWCPVLLAFALSAKKKWVKIISGIVFCFQIVCLLGSGSKSGMAALLVVGAMTAIVLCVKNRNMLKIILPCIVAFVIVWTGYDFLLGNHTISRFFTAFTTSEMDYKLQDIQALEDKIQVQFDGEIFYTGYERTENGIVIFFQDATGNKLDCEYDVERELYQINSPVLKELLLGCYEKDQVPYVFLQYRDLKWLFSDKTEDGTYTYITVYGKSDEIKKAETTFSGKLDGLFTYRGYIWNRTLPLLKKYIFIGSGPDTFLVTFPQNDYLARAAAKKGFFTEILTRPHNFYLQIALQTGVLSLICLLVFIGWILYKAIKYISCKSKEEDKEERIWTIGLLCGITAYLITGIANDSSLVTAPGFWMLLGILAGIVCRQSGSDTVLKDKKHSR